MPRPKLLRKLRRRGVCSAFAPDQSKHTKTIFLTADEIEALYLKDLQSLNQAEAAKRMCVSSSTFQRTLSSAHKKVAESIINGCKLKILHTVQDLNYHYTTRKGGDSMPRRDGTGPEGKGQQTGRGLGPCGSEDDTNNAKTDTYPRGRGARRRGRN